MQEVKTRVLITSGSYLFGEDGAGGEQRVAYNIAKGLVKKGYRVTVLSPKVSRTGSIEAMEVGGYDFDPFKDFLRYRLNWWLYSIESLLVAWRLTRIQGFHILHHIRPASPWAFSLCWTLKRPFVYGPVPPPLHIQEGIQEFRRGRRRALHGLATRAFNLFHTLLAPSLWRFTLKKASIVLVQTEKAKEGLPNGIEEKVRTIGLGVDTDLFFPSGDEEEGPTILYLANLTRQKGLEYLLRAMAYVVRDLPEARLIVVGGGPGRQYYEDLSGRLGLKERVDFVGRVAHGETVRYYSRSWIYCLPSIEEPSANTILEAMGCGRPVIATDGGGNRDIIEDGKTGILVPPRDPDSLAKAIVRLLKDEDLRKDMGRKGRERVERCFSLSRLIERIEDAYREVLRA